MQDQNARRLASTTDELFAAAANADEPMDFVTAAVSLLETKLDDSSVMIAEAKDGVWTGLLAADPSAPSTLLATVADSLTPAHDDDWIAVPLLRLGQQRSAATPQILLAASTSTERAHKLSFLQRVAPRLSGLIDLIASRTDAKRAYNLQQLQRELQTLIHNEELDERGLTDWLTHSVKADGCYVFEWDEEQNQFTASVSEKTITLSWPKATDQFEPTLLFRANEDETASNGPQVRAELHQANELCGSLSSAIDRTVSSALVAWLATTPSKTKSDATTVVIAIREHQSPTFKPHDLATLTTLSRELATVLLDTQAEPSSAPQLLGESDAIESMKDRIRRIAPTELSALIMGENGTGKEVVSRQIHALSARHNSPFLAVNCGALSETLLESELFGHEQGAFTDAHEARAGKFEVATGGTLFLDEIGELAPSGQVKLLRVLEEKIVVRVGGTQPILTDVRILAATNRDLSEMVRDGGFREDLFFRLNAVTIELPPLRDRPGDVQSLALHFLSEFARQTGRSDLRLTPESLERLNNHAWPGNVRELRNLIERVAFLAKNDEIVPADLELPEKPPHSSIENLNEATRGFQVAHIEAQIAAAEGNMTEAAQRLGLHRSNLYRKMNQLGMQAGE